MTEPVAEPVAPAKPYTVTDVAGHVPVVLDDFVGATTVLVAADDREYRLRGAGKRDGQAVEFHEKEPASAADDAPVWRIIERGEGDIVAEPPRVEPDSHAARGRSRLPERQECVGVVMDAREELTSILRVAAAAAIAGGHPVLTYEGYADAAVLAGWRPPPTVITDPAGLAEVPDGTVVLDALGVPRQLAGRLWVGTSDGSLPAQQVPLPGTVLHIPLRGAMAP